MNYTFKMMAVVLALGMMGLGVTSAYANKILNCSNCGESKGSSNAAKTLDLNSIGKTVKITGPFTNDLIFKFPDNKLTTRYRCNTKNDNDSIIKANIDFNNNKVIIKISGIEIKVDLKSKKFNVVGHRLTYQEKANIGSIVDSFIDEFVNLNILKKNRKIELGKTISIQAKAKMFGLNINIEYIPINYALYNGMHVLNSQYLAKFKGEAKVGTVNYGYVTGEVRGIVSSHLENGFWVQMTLNTKVNSSKGNSDSFSKKDCTLLSRELLHPSIMIQENKLLNYTPPSSIENLLKINKEQSELIKALNKKFIEVETIKQKILFDTEKPIINAFTKLNGPNAVISGRVTDNIEVAEVLIDGEQLSLTNNGTFKTELYIPRNGLNIEIVAYDKKGNKASKLIKIERGAVAQTTGPLFDRLNPSGKRVKSNPNALALIIGVADYSRTTANALYADKDAQQFYDYATMKLGIPSGNIKELVNDKADRVEIGLAVQDWIARSTKSGKTDIYVFFAGHGLASDDGKNMFLLPYDGSPRLLKASAIRRKELFDNIQQSNPRSVTVFLDTCYSGTTRGTDMLIASRPIAIRALEQSIPSNFTVFSAAAGDQTSKPLEEAKHGMFSYFLMKGMEGDADTNADNKITARELHAYVEQNVVQQSSGSQTPELQGDKDRVLVQFN